MQTFFSLGDRAASVIANKKCQSCQSDASLKSCGDCTVKYCNKVCNIDWFLSNMVTLMRGFSVYRNVSANIGSERINECRALTQINDWKGRNWGVFDDYWNYVA
jgi:hypothetical protein